MKILMLPMAFALFMILSLFLLLKLMFSWWILPMRKHYKLQKGGFGGPSPSFPLGNIQEMKKKSSANSSFGSSNLTHDIHSNVFPYFSRWQSSHGQLSNTYLLFRYHQKKLNYRQNLISLSVVCYVLQMLKFETIFVLNFI